MQPVQEVRPGAALPTAHTGHRFRVSKSVGDKATAGAEAQRGAHSTPAAERRPGAVGFPLPPCQHALHDPRGRCCQGPRRKGLSSSPLDNTGLRGGVPHPTSPGSHPSHPARARCRQLDQSCDFRGPEQNGNMGPLCPKMVTNFKVITTEHETKCRALSRVRSWTPEPKGA